MSFKNFKLIALIFVLIIIVILGYFHYQSSSNEMSEKDIEKYGKEYLENYKNLVEKIDIKYQSGFPFYNGYPYRIVGIMSSIQGSGIEFVPDKNKGFEIIHTDKEMDDYFIEYENKSNGSVFHITNSGIILTQFSIVANNKGRFFEMNENASFFVRSVNFYPEDENSRYVFFNYVYFKGKLKRHWTLDQARQDSASLFDIEFWELFKESEEFRQYDAIPELKAMIDEINYKRKYRLYKNFMEFKTDFDKVIEVGESKYKISSEFTTEMYEYEFENIVIQKVWYENYIFILSLIVFIFGSILDFFKITNIHGFIIKILKKTFGFMTEQWRELKLKLLNK